MERDHPVKGADLSCRRPRAAQKFAVQPPAHGSERVEAPRLDTAESGPRDGVIETAARVAAIVADGAIGGAVKARHGWNFDHQRAAGNQRLVQPAQDCQIVFDVFEYIQHDDGIEAFAPAGGGDIGLLNLDLVQRRRGLARGRNAAGVDVDRAHRASRRRQKRGERAGTASHLQHLPPQVGLDLREDPAVVGAGRAQPIEPLILDSALVDLAHGDVLPVRRRPPGRALYLRPSAHSPAANLARSP